MNTTLGNMEAFWAAEQMTAKTEGHQIGQGAAAKVQPESGKEESSFE